MLRSGWFYAIAGLLLVAIYVASQLEPRSADTRPVIPRDRAASEIERLAERDDVNVLFILIDTLRAHRLRSYGYERNTAPTLDYLAATGARFAHQLAQSSWTKCSMASLWTALYPVRTGVLRHQHAVSEAARMPAEILREAGFRTGGIWRNGWVAPNFGFSQGFELYLRPKPSPVPASVRRENPSIKLEGSDGDAIESAAEFLRVHREERWFLYLHLMDVHQYVYDERSALFGTGYSDIYDNSIRWVDRLIRLLLNELDERDLFRKTLVVVASDHGEAFGEHGREGHAQDLYGEVIEVPLILGFPFRLEQGLVVDAESANVDIWPTLFELIGLPARDGVDGRSRVPSLLAAARGEAGANGAGTVFAQIDQTWGRTERKPRPLVTVSEAGHRFILHVGQADRAELYRKWKDPGEQQNVADEAPEVRARLRARAEEYLASPPPPWGEVTPEVELDDMMLNQLRALGYKVN